jgi:hypothetical protein
MGLTFLPTRTSGSVGATKYDAVALPYANTILPSGEWNNAAQTLVDVCAEMGLSDGSTFGSIVSRSLDIEKVVVSGTILLKPTSDSVVGLYMSGANSEYIMTPEGIRAGSNTLNPAFYITTSGSIKNTGDIFITTGDSDTENSGSGGDIVLNAGDSPSLNGSAGKIEFYAGDSAWEAGNINLFAGNVTSSAGGYAGDVNLIAGYNDAADGGNIQLTAGRGNVYSGDGNGGSLSITVGSGSRTLPNFQGVSSLGYYDEHGKITLYQHSKSLDNSFVWAHQLKLSTNAQNTDQLKTVDIFTVNGNPNTIISASSGSLAIDGTNGFIYLAKAGTYNTDWFNITPGITNFKIKTSSYQLNENEDFLIAVSSSTVVTMTLPDNPTQGRTYEIKDIKGNASLNNICVSSSNYKIDGQGTTTISFDYGSVKVVYFNSGHWGVV